MRLLSPPEFKNIEKSEKEIYFTVCIYGLSFVFVAALIVYGQQLWVPGFFHDGYLYAALGKNAAAKNQWWLNTLSQKNYNVFSEHPPLTFILEGLFFRLFGHSWTVARLFNCLFAWAILATLMGYLKKRGHLSWAYFTGTILVLCPPMFRNARFPNTDIPLTFFLLLGVLSYFEAYQRSVDRNSSDRNDSLAKFRPQNAKWFWSLTGLFFGLALLTKGPPALVLAFTIGLHLILTKKIALLKSPWPWLSFLLGCAIFCLWPYFLWQQEALSGFMHYVNKQFFGTIIEGRGETKLNIFTYLIDLLTKTLPWFVLSCVGIYQLMRKREENPLGLLFVAFFLSVVVPFSFMRWKYSHYILPCYPPMAAIAGLVLSRFTLKFHRYYSYFFQKIILVFGLLVLLFPLTNKIRRDPEIFAILDIVKNLPEKPDDWLMIGGVYPYYSLVNLVAWVDAGEVSERSLADIEDEIKAHLSYPPQEADMASPTATPLKKWIVLLRKEDVILLENKYPQAFSEVFAKVIYFAKKDMMVLMSTSMFQQKMPGNSFLHFNSSNL